MPSLPLLCGGEHRPELLHRERERADACVFGSWEVVERVEVHVEGVRHLAHGRPLGVGVDAG